jgi:hypothetical protein
MILVESDRRFSGGSVADLAIKHDQREQVLSSTFAL